MSQSRQEGGKVQSSKLGELSARKEKGTDISLDLDFKRTKTSRFHLHAHGFPEQHLLFPSPV